MAVWLLFAASAVGVGFGAVGLVGDPFADQLADAAAVPVLSSPRSSSNAGPSRPGQSSSTGSTPDPTTTKTRGPNGTGAPVVGDRKSGAGASPSATTSGGRDTASASSSSRATGSGSSGSKASVSRTIVTRGGLVSATCSGDTVKIGASPAVGWQIDEIEGSGSREAKVRFERSDDGDGRVEVRATCAAGSPRFAIEDDSSDHGGEGSDGETPSSG